MNRTDINPWKWQEQFSFHQAIDVAAPQRMVVLAGQGPVDAEGHLVHEGDMDKQIELALDNMETVLVAAGLTMADVVRLTIFTTDMDRFFQAYGTYAGRLAAGGCTPASSLIGVARLALPGMHVEFEATAVA